MGSYLSYLDAVSDNAILVEYIQGLHEELVCCSSEATAEEIRQKIRDAHDFLNTAAAANKRRDG